MLGTIRPSSHSPSYCPERLTVGLEVYLYTEGNKLGFTYQTPTVELEDAIEELITRAWVETRKVSVGFSRVSYLRLLNTPKTV